MSEHSVLIIDDDKTVQRFISKILSEEYSTTCANDGVEGIHAARQGRPDVILLDVEMPGMNGYEVCDALKQDKATEDIPVVFLSSRTSTREKMIGYEVGAADFLSKPCDKEELIAKLNIHCDLHLTHKSLVGKVENASQTALTAMAGNSEYWQIIQFMETSYEVSSFDQLAFNFFKVTNDLGLNCCLFFSASEGNKFFSSRANVTPLETELMTALKERGDRFTDFGRRTQITYPRVSLLIKNMPLDDMEKYGRYKDLLPSLLSATDAKIKALDTEHALSEQSKSLSSIFETVSETFIGVADALDKSQTEVATSMKGMLTDLEMKLPHMGLEEDQEGFILQRIEEVIDHTHELNAKTDSIRGSFQGITRMLNHLSERQKTLMNSLFSRFEENADKESAEEDSSSDIELF